MMNTLNTEINQLDEAALGVLGGIGPRNNTEKYLAKAARTCGHV
jgi:hypothetical protein